MGTFLMLDYAGPQHFPATEHPRLAADFLRQLVALDGVRGAGIVQVRADGGVELISSAFAPDLDATANADSLRAWAAENSWREWQAAQEPSLPSGLMRPMPVLGQMAGSGL